MNNKGEIVIGILAGIVLGTALGILFSPHRGAVTRRIIRRKGENIADEAAETIKETIEQLADTITEKFETLKKDVKSIIHS